MQFPLFQTPGPAPNPSFRPELWLLLGLIIALSAFLARMHFKGSTRSVLTFLLLIGLLMIAIGLFIPAPI